MRADFFSPTVDHARSVLYMADDFEGPPFALEGVRLAARCARAAAEAGFEAAALEARRTQRLHAIRDEIVAARGLAATPAETEARKSESYIDLLDEIAALTAARDELRVLATCFSLRAEAQAVAAWARSLERAVLVAQGLSPKTEDKRDV